MLQITPHIHYNVITSAVSPQFREERRKMNGPGYFCTTLTFLYQISPVKYTHPHFDFDGVDWKIFWFALFYKNPEASPLWLKLSSSSYFKQITPPVKSLALNKWTSSEKTAQSFSRCWFHSNWPIPTHTVTNDGGVELQTLISQIMWSTMNSECNCCDYTLAVWDFYMCADCNQQLMRRANQNVQLSSSPQVDRLANTKLWLANTDLHRHNNTSTYRRRANS